MRPSSAARRALRLLSLAMALVLLAATPTAALAWRAPRLLHESEVEMRFDAAFHGSEAAVAWIDRDGPEIGHFGFAGVMDAGTGPVYGYSAGEADAVAISVCDGGAYLATIAGDELTLARTWLGGGGVELVSIRRGMDEWFGLDVACAGGRVWVAWTERVATGWHAFLRTVRISDLVRDGVRDMGSATGLDISVAATNARAVAAWEAAAGGLRLKRFTVGPGPRFPVTPLATTSMVPRGGLPIVAIDGQRIVLGYTQRFDAWVRTSTNGGATFSAARKLAENGLDEFGQKLPAWFTSIGVAGRQVVAIIAAMWPPVPVYHRARTGDFGSAWSVAQLDLNARMAGFLTTAAGPKIAEVRMRTGIWDDLPDWRITFHRQR